MNPAKMAFAIAKIVLEIKDVRGAHSSNSLRWAPDLSENQGWQDNLGAIERRIILISEDLVLIGEARAGWNPRSEEEAQAIARFEAYVGS